MAVRLLFPSHSMIPALFLATLSQTLQACAPVAIALVWLVGRGDIRTARAVRRGMLASLPVTVLAAALFRNTAQQARVETALAVAALAVSAYFVTRAWGNSPGARGRFVGEHVRSGLAAAITVLLIVRQSMEIGVVLFAAAIEVRSAGASATIGFAATAGIAACVVLLWTLRHAPSGAARSATRAFSLLFLAQVCVYALHEASEAHLLPWSDLLHASTERYGPDSELAIVPSASLVLVPMAVIGLARLRAWVEDTVTATAITACLVGLVAGVLFIAGGSTDSAATATTLSGASSSMTIADPSTLSGAPRILFRSMRRDDGYGKLGVAALAAPDAGRAIVNLSCERVSYAVDNGICLQAERGVTTRFSAVVFNDTFRPDNGVELAGSPSRTRVSPDGRIGTMTVFVTGQQHGYGASTFVTKTTLVDMASRRILVDNLETFTTWKDGARFTAADFNFWGVTFARDGNAFFASLQTNGQTYLVRGDVAQRRLTVLRDNVECPSLSPDNRRIAFKKRVGPEPTAWRLYILDLDTMTEHPLGPEARYVDDQVEWLDNTRVLYALRHLGTADVWDAPIDGSGPARIFMHDAESPIVIR